MTLTRAQTLHTMLMIRGQGEDVARDLAVTSGQLDMFERMLSVEQQEKVPAFLHSAFAVMSLPTSKPVDPQAPVIRKDGDYSMMIAPRPKLADGEAHYLGVPYGPIPRLILMFVMTQAVKTQSREIELGSSFRDWLRQLGKRSSGGGARGQMSLVKQHLDRLMHCDWTIRWDGQDAGKGKPFLIERIDLMRRAGGLEAGDGYAELRLQLTEDFFRSLLDHPVPLNWVAISHLSTSALALDLYTYLAHRLPRIRNESGKVTISWAQLKTHFGSEVKSMTKFRQMVRDVWENLVSAVYPQANIDFSSGRVIKMKVSSPPVPLRITSQ
jgi:Plasmid encoded RepA protein